MANVGYIRISDDFEGEQLDEIDLDATFTDKGDDFTNLNRCLNYCRKGDVLHIQKMNRIASDVTDTYNKIKQLNDKGVTVQFVPGICYPADTFGLSGLLIITLQHAASIHEENWLKNEG